MLRVDLAVAGIPFEDSEGRRVDLHAQRTTFISNLARAGVGLATAQKLARHSTPALTANVYARLDVHHLAAAVDLLPSTNQGDRQSLRATGASDPNPAISDDPQPLDKRCQNVVSHLVHSGVKNGANVHASTRTAPASVCPEAVSKLKVNHFKKGPNLLRKT